MKTTHYIIALILLVFISACSMNNAPDDSPTTSVSSNENVAVLDYDKHVTHQLHVRQRMNLTIILPCWETVVDISGGNNESFNTIKSAQEGMKNIVIVEPKVANVDASLTLIGKSGNVYNFYLKAHDAISTYKPIISAYVNDKTIPDRIAKDRDATRCINS